jgi:hypothetical protein
MSATGGTRQHVASGVVLFAGTMMILIGVFQFFVGIGAIAHDAVFVNTPNYVLKFDTTAWGWIHLILGVIVAVTGYFLFTGAGWARMVAIGLVALQAFANFFFLPYYPLWALIIIAVDIAVIWALAVTFADEEAL